MKGMTAVAVLSAGVVASAWAVLERPVAEGDIRGEPAPTLAMAPISLGNPAAAATLRTRQPENPRVVPVRGESYGYTVRVGNGDTLTGVLVRAGIERRQAVAAIAALDDHFDPRRVRPGQQITIIVGPQADGVTVGRFLGLDLAPDYSRRISVRRDDDGGFSSTVGKLSLRRSLARSADTIRHSLFVDGTRAGIPAPVLVEMIRAYSWDVDFQRDVRRGDGFEVLYERHHDRRGEVVHNGRILFATLTLRGVRHAIYLHTTGDGVSDYFDDKGHSARKALMRTPIDGARLSSGFGRRKHPILGYNKMHRGLDFAAPRGTPIYAAGDGTVTAAGRNGGFGNYVRIRHNARYSTAYAHMTRIATRKGRRVKQGQVIGYVGSTGSSTGPHLHYEILTDGRQVNPLKVKMPSGRRLKGDELARFQVTMADTDRLFATAAEVGKLASFEE